MLLTYDPFPAARLGLGPSVAVLLLGLLLLCGGPQIHSAGGQVGRGSSAAAVFPHPEPLAGTSTTTAFSTQTLPSSLAGVNGTTWEDDSGGTCAECTYSVYLQPSTGAPNTYFLAIWYQSDPACPPAVGTEFVNLDIGANGTMLNDNPGFTHMELCTRASNPIVQDCGQDQIWYVDDFTLTVTQNSISGQYQSQYWTWETASGGAITNCAIESNYEQTFTLTPVLSSTSLSSGASATSQQDTGTATSPSVQASGSSRTSSSSSSSSTTTSTHSGGSGYLGIEILAAASAVIVVAAGVSWAVLRKRPSVRALQISIGVDSSRIQSPSNH
jgi:hypothetical protein